MSQHSCILLLGSNLGDRKSNLILAKYLIYKYIGVPIHEGIILETEPIGFTSETNFYNQIIQVQTCLSPFQVLKKAKHIEKQMGRVYLKPKKSEQYTSRIIDIDILLFGRVKLQSPQLLIPHPQIFTRKFVLELLKEIE